MLRIIALVFLLLCGPVAAQVPMTGAGKGSPGGGGPSPATYTPVIGDSQAIGFGSSSYTSPSKTWPAGVAVIFVTQGVGGAAGTLTAVTINGVSATQIGAYTTNNVGSLWQATVSSGTGTVQLTSSSVFGGVGVSGGVVTTTTTTSSSSQINPMGVVAEPQAAVTITVPANGIGVVFAGGAFGSAASLPFTWSAGGTRDAVTEAVSAGGGSADVVTGGAHVAAGTTATPGVATANTTFAFTGTSGAMGAVAFSP